MNDVKLYYYNINKRVYEKNGIVKSSPYEEFHYVPIEIVSETDKEFICRFGTINKRSMLYKTNSQTRVRVFTEKEVSDNVYVAENRHLISERIKKLEADKLRKVEELLKQLESQ